MQGIPMDNSGRAQSVLGSAQQVNQNLPQVDFPQGDAVNTGNFGQFGFRQDQQNKIPGGILHPDLSLMTDAQIQAYGVAMNQKFMQFKQRAISTLPNLPNDHPSRAVVQSQISMWQSRRNQLTQECQKRGLKFDFLSNDGFSLGRLPAGGAPEAAAAAAQALLNTNLYSAPDASEDWPATAQPSTQSNTQIPQPSPSRAGMQQGLPMTPTQPGMQATNMASREPPPMIQNVFYAQINKIFQSRGRPMPRAEINGRPFDAYDAYTIVNKLGGVRQVSERKEWVQVASQLGLLTSNPNENSGIAEQLQQFYLGTCVETESAWRNWWAKRQQQAQDVNAQRNLLAMQAQNAQNARQGLNEAQRQAIQGMMASKETQDQASQASQPENAKRAYETLKTAMLIIEPGRLNYLRGEVAKLPPSEIQNLGLPPQELLFVRHCVNNAQMVDMAMNTQPQAPRPPSVQQPSQQMSSVPTTGMQARLATPEELQTAQYMLRQAYQDVRNPSIPPSPIPDNEKPHYESWIKKARMIGSTADLRMLSLLCSNGQNMQDDRLKIACSLTNLLREVSRVWRDTGMAILPLNELSKAVMRLSADMNSWQYTVHVSAPLLQQVSKSGAQLPVAGSIAAQPTGVAPSVSTPVSASPSVRKPGGEHTPADLAPRLRMEDLSLPPAKRTKTQNSSPIASTPPAKAPAQAKKPAKKAALKRKASVSAANRAAAEVKSSPAGAPATPAEDTNATPVATSIQNMAAPTINPAVSSEVNALGVRLGEEAVKARLREEEQGRANPIDFLTQSLTGLRNYNAQAGLEQQAMDAALGFSLPAAYANSSEQWEANVAQSSGPSASKTTTTAWQLPQTHPTEEVFDYSYFIDDSALGNDEGGEEEEQHSGDALGSSTTLPQVAKPVATVGIDSTPELVSGSTIDPSPSSDNAITPAATKHGAEHAPFHAGVSPTIQRTDIYGEDGWLGTLNTPSQLKWDGDNTPALWPMETIT